MKKYTQKLDQILKNSRNYYADGKEKLTQYVGINPYLQAQHTNFSTPASFNPFQIAANSLLKPQYGESAPNAFDHQQGLYEPDGQPLSLQTNYHKPHDVESVYSAFMHQYGLYGTGEQPVNQQIDHPIGNAATLGPQRPHVPSGSTLLSTEIIGQIPTRAYSALVKLGSTAVEEACKGLSRVIRPADEADIQSFGSQLVNMDQGAIATNYRICVSDRIPCFAVSYVQSQTAQGRFKFSKPQWESFHIALRAIAESGVRECRIWLDQCLWLRDASQDSWAHTGIVPYVLWPVISLGDKVIGADRTTASYERMWPFVEELAGLWSLGVIATSEMRGRNVSEGVRRWLSFNHRTKLEPEQSLEVLLLNIYHGAADGLRTGWKEDVKELEEMARWNFHCESENLIVGVDWRIRTARAKKVSAPCVIPRLLLPQEQRIGNYVVANQGINIYLDGSRKTGRGSWDGFQEWLSGNEGTFSSEEYGFYFALRKVSKYNIITDKGEFQLLGEGCMTGQVLWLLVAMDGRSSGFSRGRVAWTKVMSGRMTCFLPGDVCSGDTRVISEALQENVGVAVRVISAAEVGAPIEWV